MKLMMSQSTGWLLFNYINSTLELTIPLKSSLDSFLITS